MLRLVLVAFFTIAAALEQAPLGSEKRPNIVFILTDDQDLHMESLDYMPLLRKYITNEGTFYKRHHCFNSYLLSIMFYAVVWKIRA